MVPERPRTVPKGPGSAPEGSGMSRNDPRRSRKVLEASGRFQKFTGSTTHYPMPLALGGKPPRLPWPAKEVGAHQGEGILLQVGIPKPKYGRFPVGRCGKVWKVWESKLDSPPPLLRPKGLLATYIMWGRGGRRSTTCPQGLCATLPPLIPVAPQLDPGLDVVLDQNPLGFSPSSFLGGVLLWMAERCWIAATGCVDTGRGIITLILLRGSSSSRRSVRGTCSWDRSMDCLWEIYFDYFHYVHPLHQLFFRCNRW